MAAGQRSTVPSGMGALRAGFTQPSRLMSAQRSVECVSAAALVRSVRSSGITQCRISASKVERPSLVTGPRLCITSSARSGNTAPNLL